MTITADFQARGDQAPVGIIVHGSSRTHIATPPFP